MDHIRPPHPALQPPLVLDITRLVVRAKRTTPSGIDRFEFAYTDWLVNDPRPATFLIQWRGSSIGVRRPAVARFVERLRERWMGGGDLAADAQFQRCVGFLEDRATHGQAMAHPPARSVIDTTRLLAGARVRNQPRREDSGTPAVYLNVGHWHLERLPQVRRRLGDHAGNRIAVLVHDLLPIEVPEYFSAEGRIGTERRMAAAADHADLLLFTSEAMKQSFTDYARRTGSPVPQALVLPPGIESEFGAPATNAPRPTRPYFVVCGNIEARKNHLLLLGIWRALAASDGEQAPRLVVVGRRGWHAESVLSTLDRSPLMGTSVIEVADLGTAGLASLLSGACALLMPSFAEGYGIPIMEARACGVPVICSDIPAHREVGGPGATYLDPIDGIGWMREIRRLTATPRRSPPAAVMRWAEYFVHLSEALSVSLPAR